jgi:hypothetical protein
MNIRKIVVLASMVVAAAACAVPAAASGAVWQHEGEALEEHVEIGLSGGQVFEVPGSGVILCPVHATLTAEGGETGQITEWDVATEECFGSGKFAGCEAVASEALGLPWGVDVNAASLTITGSDISREFAGCGLGSVEFTTPEIDVTTETPGAISEVEFIGEGTAHLEGGEAGYRTFGSFTVDGEDAGTYGIG